MPPPPIQLRKTSPSDLDTLFLFQLDPEANHMAAFTSKNPADKKAYLEKYSALLKDPSIHMYTICSEHSIVGSIAKFEIEGQPEITYWINRAYWGKGIATEALRLFLPMEPARPLQARVAFDNTGSQKVLEKCGFVKVGRDSGFANARQQETEEFIYELKP